MASAVVNTIDRVGRRWAWWDGFEGYKAVLDFGRAENLRFEEREAGANTLKVVSDALRTKQLGCLSAEIEFVEDDIGEMDRDVFKTLVGVLLSQRSFHWRSWDRCKRSHGPDSNVVLRSIENALKHPNSFQR